MAADHRVPHAALELLIACGYDATSVDELAEAAGISRSTFFRRYSSKEEMVFADHEERLAAARAALVRHSERGADAVVPAALTVFDAHAADPELARLRRRLLHKVPALRDRELVSTHRFERLFRDYLLGVGRAEEPADGVARTGAGAEAGAGAVAVTAPVPLTLFDVPAPAGANVGLRAGSDAGVGAVTTNAPSAPAVGPLLVPDARRITAVSLAAAVVAVHNDFLRSWLREPSAEVRPALEAALSSLVRQHAHGAAGTGSAPSAAPTVVVVSESGASPADDAAEVERALRAAR